jgi:spore coat protein JB
MENDNLGCEGLLLKLQELCFAAVDLNLYLDNHPENKNALADYDAISREIKNVKKIYETENGPLTNFGCSESKYPWAWTNEPWPWELNE